MVKNQHKTQPHKQLSRPIIKAQIMALTAGAVNAAFNALCREVQSGAEELERLESKALLDSFDEEEEYKSSLLNRP